MNEDLQRRLDTLLADGDAEGLYRVGMALYRLRRLPDAEPFLRAAHAAGHIPACEMLAALLDTTGREAEAEPLYREAIAAGSDVSQVHLADMLLADESRWPEAEELLRRAIERDVPRMHGHFVLGKLLGQWPGREAEAEAPLAAITDPVMRPIAQYELAKVLRELPGRETDVEQALRASGLPDADALLARILSDIPERRREAVTLNRRAAENGVPGAWNNLTVLLQLMRDVEGALAAFRDAIAAGEDQMIVFYGELLRVNGYTADAEQVLRSGLESDPRCAMVLGAMLMAGGDRAGEGRQLLVAAAGAGVGRAAVYLARPRPW